MYCNSAVAAIPNPLVQDLMALGGFISLISSVMNDSLAGEAEP